MARDVHRGEKPRVHVLNTVSSPKRRGWFIPSGVWLLCWYSCRVRVSIWRDVIGGLCHQRSLSLDSPFGTVGI